jgi:hypothetical protein
MSLGHGASIVKNGLEFYYDMSNVQKSWKGAPTTNLLFDSGIINWTTSNLTGSVTRSTVVENQVYRFTSTTGGTFRISVPLVKLTNNLPYNMSYKYRFISGTSTTFSMSDWCDVSLQNRVDINTLEYNFSSAYGVRSTYDSIYRFMDFNISANTVVEIWDIQLEQREFATPYVNGTRTNTQAILDLTSKHTITTNELTYNSDNTFSFNGNTSYVVPNIPFTIWNNSFTINQWCYFLDDSRGILVGDFSTVGAINTAFEKHTDRRMRLYWNAAPDIFTSNNVIDLNTWQYVTCVRDKATSRVLFYVNGDLKYTYNGALSDKVATVPHRMGADGRTGTTVVFGSIPITQIYNRALSESEVKQNFEALRGRYGI